MMDFHVVGAGPAGLFAALAAAKNSANVIVSEEHKDIGLPVHCSGLISVSGFEELNKIVKYKKIIINKIYCAKIYTKNNYLEIKYHSPKAYLVDRREIDYQAYQNASEEGVKFEQKKIRSIADLKAKKILGADGPISTIAKIFDFPPIKKFVFCYQGEYKYHNEDKKTVELYFDKELFGGFFGWKIPINEELAKIGFGVTNQNLFKAKKAFLAKLCVLDQKPLNSFIAPIPLRMRAKTTKTTSKYFVSLAGDSAGQTKASSGGGIYFGAMCGFLAGKYYEDNKKYEIEWKKNYYFDLYLHQIIQKIIEKSSNRQLDLILDYIKILKIDKYLEKYGEMDRLTKMFEIKKMIDYFNMVL
ncbi:MAG: NAD(P)/FAD-dependent oxidoreductase [Candidatus Anstonellaceae archaeon]